MPIPDETRDRWGSRAEPGSGKGAVYWHILFGDDPAVRATAREAQARLASFRDLHMTPGEWLHATALVAGTTDDISGRGPGPDACRGAATPRQSPAGQRDDFQGPVSPGGDHAGVHARRCPRSHPRRCAAGHADGNGANGQRDRACRAVGSPYDHLLQHGTSSPWHPSPSRWGTKCRGATSPWGPSAWLFSGDPSGCGTGSRWGRPAWVLREARQGRLCSGNQHWSV